MDLADPDPLAALIASRSAEPRVPFPHERLLADRIISSDWLADLIREAQAEAWDERNDARPQYLGPRDGHYDDCAGWEDCYCDSYPNPYRSK
jgi:hypothetical protein